MTDDIYQTIKSTLEEARGDRYPRLARLLGPVEPHIKVNYEGSDQVKAGDALAKEKARHEKITEALDWIDNLKKIETENTFTVRKVENATEIRIEPSDDLGQHTGDGESGTPAETSGSSSAIEREKIEEN